MEFKTLESSEWKGEMSLQLGQLFQDDVFGDIILESGEMKIHAHRIILASASVSFRAMLTGDMTENQSRTLTIDSIDGRSLKELVRFCYTGSITITSDSVYNLLEGSEQLQLKWVTNECENFLVEKIDLDNVIRLYDFSKRLNCRRLMNNCLTFLSYTFKDMVESNKILSWNFDILLKLLQRDKLSARSEEYIFKACLKWIDHDREHREKHFEEIFVNIRINDLPKPFVNQHIVEEKMVQKSPKCLEKLNHFMKSPHQPSGRARIPEYIFLLHMEFGSKILACTIYDLVQKKCLYCSEQVDGTSAYPWYDVFSWGGKIFLTDRSPAFLGIYDLGNIIDIGKMCLDDIDLSAICLVDNKLYFFGGSRRSGDSEKPIRYFDMKLETWHQVGSINDKCSDREAVHMDGFIYLIGGANKSKGESARLHRYEIKSGSLKQLTKMHTERKGHAVCCLNGKIYVAGGTTRGHVGRSVEVYDPETDRWHQVAEMICERNKFKLLPVMNKLWAIEYDMMEHMNCGHKKNMEIYDPETDKWSLGPELPELSPVRGCGAVNEDVFKEL